MSSKESTQPVAILTTDAPNVPASVWDEEGCLVFPDEPDFDYGDMTDELAKVCLEPDFNYDAWAAEFANTSLQLAD
ncbi:hypothetical protein [Jonesia denitrificans]|uniref:Uncharacterized protein n=1 Tax=Jonesia denitrificans (strain ATCC 14870 / DSM 20603 / BCRC 15368 / CIP 55.134 / JCM 11481 / NBRC 15587 / NCTC 10816 / Prevot 55134) TaxID=471856 RepID=C7R1V8_JONDD|nr:hypothetical protein [Jonesia denitrificans]ACV08426.1 hypothetical protein Jden_0763 [Jonesia denitrificans DSM 20603]ASE07928.1 hypothetical protein CEP80_01350 [Jonesia denitrificans]QXB42536.1 hypothetical protein I6L70_08210 [Jonesia denitrificans]SQH20405.1 Uncharacterised protein [Jonesia denitrificans]